MFPPSKIASALVAGSLVFASGSLLAETGAVVGYVTLDIQGGTAQSPRVSTISLPLYAPVTGSGSVAGRITGVGASTISNSSANWTADAFGSAPQPYFLKITSGASEGRILSITSNTSTAATVDNQGTPLDTLGIATGAGGDTYEIFPADTISSVFGTPADGVLGGTSGAAADQVQVLNPSGVWEAFYYDTNANAWLAIDGGANADHRAIRPDEGMVYLRRALTPMQIVLSGRVPDTDSRIAVSNSTSAALGSTWPIDTTLAASGIANMDGWITGPVATADQVQIYTPSKGWLSYFHNGTTWMRVGPSINSDNVPIAAGTAVILARRNTAAGSTVLSQAQPYDLNN